MSDWIGKNALIIIPKSQFCEEEFSGIRFALKDKGVRVVVLSKFGKEARGMKRYKFQPDEWKYQLKK